MYFSVHDQNCMHVNIGEEINVPHKACADRESD